MLYESIVAKETEAWSLKQANCEDTYSNGHLTIQKGKEKLRISVFDLKTPEQAKLTLDRFHSQGRVVQTKEYGEDGIIVLLQDLGAFHQTLRSHLKTVVIVK